MARGDIQVIKDTRKLQSLIRTAPRDAERILNTIAFDGERYVKQSFGTSPSSPGSTPGVDTGALRASIHVETPSRFQRLIVAGTDYGAFLEFGTTRMAARPFFTPMSVYLRNNLPTYWDGFLE